MDSELFMSEVKSDLPYGMQGTYQSERENQNKSVSTQVKPCMQKQAFDLNAALVLLKQEAIAAYLSEK